MEQQILSGIVTVLLIFVTMITTVVTEVRSQINKYTRTWNQETILKNPPSVEIAELADDAGMSDTAKAIFYAAEPEIIDDPAVFEDKCQAPKSGKFVELGCYSSRNKIYLRRITDPQLYGQMVSTAAHEMLHAAYSEMLPSQRNRVNELIEEEIDDHMNADLAETIKNYQITEPGERGNELHSILGTEYDNLEAELEEHYSQYFEDRAAVVSQATQFKQVFSNLEMELENLRDSIRDGKRELVVILEAGDIPRYNRRVDQINEEVRLYNETVAKYNQLSRNLKGMEGTEAEEPTE